MPRCRRVAHGVGLQQSPLAWGARAPVPQSTIVGGQPLDTTSTLRVATVQPTRPMSGAIVVAAGECCWGSQCKCPSPDMRMFTCTACRSQYHHLCADAGCPQREELDKRTECCNCAPADATTFLLPPEYDWDSAIAETNNLAF